MISLIFGCRISRENIFWNKVFKYMSIYLMIIMKMFFVEKFYWLFIVLDIVYVMLFSFINEMFNFCINNALLDRKNVVYMSKYPLENCVSNENNTDVSLTTTQESWKDLHKIIYTHTHTHTHTYIYRERGRERERHTHTHTHTHIYIYIYNSVGCHKNSMRVCGEPSAI